MNRVTHFEIPADNIERASEFYRGLFGWEIRKMPTELVGIDYWGVMTAPDDDTTPGINGGMYKREQANQHVAAYVDVESIDTCLKKVEELGGKALTEKIPVGEAGFMAMYVDTEGNIGGLWEDVPKQ